MAGSGRISAGAMLRTPAMTRDLLEAAGYAWDEEANAWVRSGTPLSPLRGRMLDGDIASMLSLEQIIAWIGDGESE